MEQLIEHFIIPLDNLIFEEYLPCMSQRAMDAIIEIADWYSSPGGTFLRVFSEEKPPYVLPRCATNKLVIQEVSYHLTKGLSVALHKKNKGPWPTLPMKKELYDIKNLKL